MNFDDPEQLCLRGKLILADPSLRDPNFFRSVLLLTEHRHDHGAHGYILNRPLGKVVGEVLGGEEFTPLREVPIYIGGPVSQEHLTFASFSWSPKGKKLSYTTHLSAKEAIQRHAAGEIVRAFVGYSGWAEGQLERELQQHAWITRKPEGNLFAEPDALWNVLLSSMGPWYRLLANSPENPTLN